MERRTTITGWTKPRILYIKKMRDEEEAAVAKDR
jgi:hypothetical protein